MLDELHEPTQAIIFIDSGKISNVIITQDIDPSSLSELCQGWDIIDYGDLFIFPGLLDINVHLHADFGYDWENIQSCTELAAAGGVTTIVDNPVMSATFETGEEYIEILQKRINKIKANSRVDFGVFGIFEPKTQDFADKIVETGVLGLKCYLLNCFQNTIGHFDRENIREVLESLEALCPDTLLLVHPELATEREIYLTSPCRPLPLRKRLDMSHAIKSMEFGGAANKGSYIEELCRKKQDDEAENDDDDDDDEDKVGEIECSIGDIDSPTKLKNQVKKTQEKTEINDLVHFELLSYSYENNEAPEIETDYNNRKDSDSDEEDVMERIVKAKSQKTLTLNKCIEIQEEKEDDKEVNEGKINIFSNEQKNSPVKFSRFASSRMSKVVENFKDEFEIPEQKEEGDTPNPIKDEKPKEDYEEEKPQNDSQSEHEEESTEIVKQEQNSQNSKKNLAALKAQKNFIASELLNESPIGKVLFPEQTVSSCFTISPLTDLNSANSTKSNIKSLGSTSQVSLRGIFNEKSKKNTLDHKRTQTRKFLASLTASESASNTPKTATSETKTATETKDSSQVETSPINGKAQTNAGTALLPFSESSQQSLEDKSEGFSPMNSIRPVGSASSSLLQRRMSLKSAINIRPSMTSILSSPGSNFTKVNSLDLFKTPEEMARKEAKFNECYRTFLANRPQNWEENAVSLILGSIKPETRLKIMFQNLSLASSFLKIRTKKKSHEEFSEKILSDTSASYLFFTEKMVGKGETKYKVSPPFRNKENRKLLVENLRLGGVDTMSSYHFFVPSKFKQVDGGNFRRAFGGLNSMGCSLQAAWTALYSYQIKNNTKFLEEPEYQKKVVNHLLRQLSKAMCARPSQLLKISHRKGSIAKGKDADFVIWDPYQTENNAGLKSNHVFAGKKLMGTVMKTYLRGTLIYDKNQPNEVIKGYSAEFITP